MRVTFIPNRKGRRSGFKRFSVEWPDPDEWATELEIEWFLWRSAWQRDAIR